MSRPPRLHIVGTRRDHARRFKGEISTLLASVLKTEPGLSPQEAMYKVEQEMLLNNPYKPPESGTCIINSLPVELLAHIFRVGVEMQRNGGSDDEFAEVEDEEEKKGLEAELKRLRDEDSDSSDDDRGADDDLPIEDDDDDPDWEDEDENGSDDGTEEDDDEDEEEGTTEEESEEDEDEEDDVPFELLVSHVCKHWRETAINTPDLWSAIYIEAPHQWDRYEVYLDRAKAQALDLEINISPAEEDDAEDEEASHNPHGDSDDYLPARLEVKRIMDLVVPKASQWRQIVIATTTWRNTQRVLQRLHEIPAAPTLEWFEFRLYDDEEPEDYDFFEPANLKEPFYLPFHGNAPNLQYVNLWSVHIDWDGAVNMFKNLNELELGYHAKDVRPSWHAFSSYLKNSPQLAVLKLKLSGPSLLDPSSLAQPPATPATGIPSAYYTAVPTLGGDDPEGDPNEWPRYPLEVPSVHDLLLSDHDPAYAYALATKLHFPNLRFLSLNYYDGDFTRIVEAYSQPLRGVTSRRSLFQTIGTFDVVNLGFVTDEAFKGMLHALNGLKHIQLDVDEEFSVPFNIWSALRENTDTVYRAVRAKKEKEPQLKSPTTNPGPADAANTSPTTTTTTSSSNQPTLTIVPPDPNASIPGPPASGSAAASGNAPSLSTIDPQLLLPHLEGMRTREISTIHLRRFLKRRIKIGAPIKQLHIHREDNVTSDDQRWFSDHLEEFDFYSDSEVEDLFDDDDDVDHWTDEGDEDGDDEDDEWEDEDEDGDEDEDEDDGGDDEEGGRIRTRRGPTAHATRGGQASNQVTTGLANLD